MSRHQTKCGRTGAPYRQRLLRFEACEARLALDGAGFESISLFDETGVTENTEGGIFFSFKSFVSSTGQFDFTIDRAWLLGDADNLMPSVRPSELFNGVGNTTAFSDQLNLFIHSRYTAGDQNTNLLQNLLQQEPIGRFPEPVAEAAVGLAPVASGPVETVSIADLLSDVSDEVSNEAIPIAAGLVSNGRPTASQSAAPNPPNAVHAVSAPLQYQRAGGGAVGEPSGLTRAWAFEVASIETALPAPQAIDGINASAPFERSHIKDSTTLFDNATLETSRLSRRLPVLTSTPRPGAQEAVDTDPNTKNNAGLLAQDEAFANLAPIEEASASSRPADHRYGLAASMLALLVADRIRIAQLKNAAALADEPL